jgi:hypothetical protein
VATPDGLTLARNRDVEDRPKGAWGRRLAIALLAVIPTLAAFNVFGQTPETTSAAVPAAQLTLYSPDRLRGGLLFSARFHIHARHDLKKAMLILDSGWLEGMSVNTIEPSPLGEASANGKLSLDLGHVPKGQSFVLYMQFQVNATNVAWKRSQDVELLDGDTPLLHLDRSVTIFP